MKSASAARRRRGVLLRCTCHRLVAAGWLVGWLLFLLLLLLMCEILVVELAQRARGTGAGAIPGTCTGHGCRRGQSRDESAGHRGKPLGHGRVGGPTPHGKRVLKKHRHWRGHRRGGGGTGAGAGSSAGTSDGVAAGWHCWRCPRRGVRLSGRFSGRRGLRPRVHAVRHRAAQTGLDGSPPAAAAEKAAQDGTAA